MIAAQESTTSDSSKINALEKGSWSVQFEIDNFLSISSFLGNNISVKYHLHPQHAIRLGISLDGYDNSQDSERLSSYERTDERRVKDFSILVKPQYLYYPYTDNKVNIFFGTGPYLSYDFRESELDGKSDYADTLSAIDYQWAQNTRYNIGISFVAGVEIFILDYLSLHAEYGSNLYYGKYEYKQSSRTTYSPSDQPDNGSRRKGGEDYYYFRYDNVLFSVSVYF